MMIFRDDAHTLTRGKLYSFRPDCAECMVEACERQQTGGLLVELGRRTVVEDLTILDVYLLVSDDAERCWTILAVS
jgi:hypothetical protein